MIAITLIGEKKKVPQTLKVLILRLVDTIITRCQCLSTLPRDKTKQNKTSGDSRVTKSLVESRTKTQTYYNFSNKKPPTQTN